MYLLTVLLFDKVNSAGLNLTIVEKCLYNYYCFANESICTSCTTVWKQQSTSSISTAACSRDTACKTFILRRIPFRGSNCVSCYVYNIIRYAQILYYVICTSILNIISFSHIYLYNSTFQTELIKEWANCLTASSSKPTRVHLIMEHFSIEMQSILDRYTTSDISDDEAFEQLVDSYKNEFGTEGHDLHPYRELLQFCRNTTTGTCNVHIHGGFIPRNHAARLNKECLDIQSKQLFFNEMSEKGYLPKEGDAMYKSLFEDSSSFKLRGSPEHELLIQSLMNGADLYSPIEESANDNEHDNVGQQEERPISKLYQAQLLKDHAMGYMIASLMLDHYEANDKSLSSDRYIVIAGYGHLKHQVSPR